MSRKIRPRIIVSAIEHESILETARDLTQGGVEVVILPVSEEGMIHIEQLRNALTPETILVSVMYANNEVGTIQPIVEVSKMIKGVKQNIPSPRPHTLNPLLHTDAVQAFQYLECNVDALGVDFMTLSGHKIYGPKGVGALYIRRGSRDWGLRSSMTSKITLNSKPHILAPITTGGGQEYGLRSGTENVSSIVGFAEAVRLVVRRREREATRATKLRDYLFQKIARHFPGAVVNGARDPRLPNNVNVRFLGHDAQDLLVSLDRRGIAVSAGSACAARSLAPSHVLTALGLSRGEARESVRITLGRPTTRDHIDALIKALVELMGMR